MAVVNSERNRAPRGSKLITQAFFEALEAIPEARRAEVAKAAQGAIRDELKARILKAKAARVAVKTRKAAPAPRKTTKAAAPRAIRQAKTRGMGRRSAGASAAA